MKTLTIIVEKHPDGYVAYPLGLKGAGVAEGDTYEEALASKGSAIRTISRARRVKRLFTGDRHAGEGPGGGVPLPGEGVLGCPHPQQSGRHNDAAHDAESPKNQRPNPAEHLQGVPAGL